MTDTDTDGIEAELLAMAEQADAGADPETIGEKQEQEPAKPATEKEADIQPADSKDDLGAEAAKKADEAPKDQGKPADDETPYQKARREGKDREAKAWQKIQEEKQAIAKERAEFESQRKQAAEPKAATIKDEAGYTADDYAKAAKGFAAEGEADLARMAQEKADALGQKEQQAAQEQQRETFIQGWEKTFQDLKKENPEIAVKDSPTYKAIEAILHERPVFATYPEGLRDAHDLYQARSKAASVPELSKQVEALNKEIQRLQKLSDPAGYSNAGKPSKAKGLSEMSDTEADAAMRRLAEEADQQQFI